MRGLELNFFFFSIENVLLSYTLFWGLLILPWDQANKEEFTSKVKTKG